MTTEELVAFPDDGIDRWLIRGELRAQPWQLRTPGVGAAITTIGTALGNWVRGAKPVRGTVLIDAYHRLAHDPDTTVGIDLSLITPVQAADAKGKPFVEGPPVVAVKFLPSARTDAVAKEQIGEFLTAGVPLIWIVNPDQQCVLVFRPGGEPKFFNLGESIVAEPELPGFCFRVAELFDSRSSPDRRGIA